jgi:hypothetical protein
MATAPADELETRPLIESLAAEAVPGEHQSRGGEEGDAKDQLCQRSVNRGAHTNQTLRPAEWFNRTSTGPAHQSRISGRSKKAARANQN